MGHYMITGMLNRMGHIRWLLACCVLWSGVASAQNVIKAVTGQYKGGLEVLTIQAQDTIDVDPASFSTQTPARIAFDFPGYDSSAERSAVQLGLKNARSATIIQANGRTRVVVNLQQAAPYMISRHGNVLEVQLADVGVESGVAKSPLSATTPSPVTTPVATGQAVRDIDFRKASDGAGRVVVVLPSQQAEVDVGVRGKALVINLPKHTLPAALKRRLDVSDFATPVQSILSEETPSGVRITVNPKGNWEHSAFQTDGRLVVDIRDQKVDPEKLVQGVGYAGEKLSLNFQNIEVRSLLQVIADFTGFNIVTSDSVSGAVTLRLKDVPWDQALDIILQARNLGMRKNGAVIWIAPKDELHAKEKIELEAKVSVESLESLQTKSFRLNYAKATEVAAQLSANASNNPSASSPNSAGGGTSSSASSSQAAGGSILSSRGRVIAEPRTNQLFITDVRSRLEQIHAFIDKVDVPVRQVLIEARIVEADDKFGRSLGVKLGSADMRGVRGGDPGYAVGGGNRVAFGGQYNAIENTVGTSLGSPSSSFFDFTARPVVSGSPATFALSLFNPSANRFLSLELSALEAENRGKIVSSPRIVTADNAPALIEQGEEIPYVVLSQQGPSTTFKKAVMKLDVTPQITPEGAVLLMVEISKDSRGVSTSSGPAINAKKIKTQVLVENGGTVMIGGIYTSDETEQENKVPLLGDVPVVGNLFKNKSREANKTELLIFLTPKVITDFSTR